MNQNSEAAQSFDNLPELPAVERLTPMREERLRRLMQRERLADTWLLAHKGRLSAPALTLTKAIEQATRRGTREAIVLHTSQVEAEDPAFQAVDLESTLTFRKRQSLVRERKQTLWSVFGQVFGLLIFAASLFAFIELRKPKTDFAAELSAVERVRIARESQILSGEYVPQLPKLQIVVARTRSGLLLTNRGRVDWPTIVVQIGPDLRFRFEANRAIPAGRTLLVGFRQFESSEGEPFRLGRRLGQIRLEVPGFEPHAEVIEDD